MKLAGFLLLPAGGVIVATAIAILATQPAMTGFLLAGIGIEVAGLVLVFRAHLPPKPKEERR